MEIAGIVLILQIFFADHKQARSETPTDSLDECIELLRGAVTITTFDGKPVIAVAGGCYVPNTSKPS